MQPTVARSTTALVVGMLLTPLGVFLLRRVEQMGPEREIIAMVGGEDPEGYFAALILGVSFLVLGVIYLVVGVVRLSRNVDLAAQAAAEQLRARNRDVEATAPKD